MATILEFQKRLEKVANRAAIEKILFDEIKRYKNVFLNQQKKQLNEGEDNEGDLFGVYTEATENWPRNYTPRKPKVAGEPYNFQDTGGLFDGMELLIDGAQAQFWSTDSKTPELVVKYDNLFGLQDDNLKEVITKIIYPAFMLQIRKQLLLE